MTSRHFESQRLMILGAAALLVFSAVPAGPAGALPLYASREGMTCNTCHIDPNGSGMRNGFGFNYGKNRHSMGEEEKWSNVTVDPQLNDWIRLGLDMRFMYYTSWDDGSSPFGEGGPSTFFPMQGNVGIAITPHDQLTVVATHGAVVDSPGFPDGYIARELYGLFHGLPLNGFIQAGRFRIPLGLRQDDHTSFIRTPQFYFYDSQSPDAGIEIGSIGRNWFAQVSATNGGEPFAEQARTYTAKVGRVSRRIQVGVSGMHRETDGFDATVDRWTGYLSATHGRFTVLGEYGGGSTEFPSTITRNLEAAFGELNFRAGRGVNIRGKIDYIGPRGGTTPTRASRYTADIDLNPMPFTEIKLSYRRTNYATSSDLNELFAMLFIPF